jgi:AmmeMemoRadiSam system protein B
MEIVGFASTADQMDQVLVQSEKLASHQSEIPQHRFGWHQKTPFVAGVCPHDDYYYAGRLYALLLPHLCAKHVIVFGVFHKAKIFECRDRMVFDSYHTWQGPYGPILVSPLRKEIIRQLPETDYIIDDDMQLVEHSIEAIVPFLQAYRRDVEIIPILMPYMNWEVLDRLAIDLTEVLQKIIHEQKWQLGEDVSIVCSSDAVHYGDVGWRNSKFAPFGVDIHGYRKAVKRDIEMAEKYLSGEMDLGKLRKFLYRCVNPKDVTKYRIPWCGRFSVPFGLNVAIRLAKALEGQTLQGFLLDYGTSISEASLEVEGLGPTAPNNLHHWVGYAAIGYQLYDKSRNI